MFQYWHDDTALSRSWNYQLYRLIAESPYGGGVFGEIHRAASRMRLGNLEDWHRGWYEAGAGVLALAEEALIRQRRVTALPHLLRAFNYFRAAEFFLPQDDPRRLATYGTASECFARAAELMDPPAQPVEVEYEGSVLTGYYFPPHGAAGDPAPAVFFISGADAFPEENYFRGVTFLIERGMGCICVNCPGQGSALRIQGLPSRYDYEKPVSRVLDYLAARPDVDKTRLGLLGESMGGYYAPRAAAFDSRVKALAICGALYDVLGDLYDPYPPIRGQLEWVVGAKSEEEARAALSHFTLEGVMAGVDCPLLLVHGEDDELVPVRSALRTYEEAAGEKTLQLYPSGGAGSGHGQLDDRARNIPLMADWLADRLDAKEKI